MKQFIKEAEFSCITAFFCLLGIGAYWAWSGSSLITASIWPNADMASMHTSWLVNVATHGGCLLLFGCLATNLAPYSKRHVLVVAAPALIIVGTIALSVGFTVPSLAGLALAGSAVSGIGTSLILLMWGETCALLEEGDMQRLTLSGSVIVGLLIILLIACLPAFVSLLVCLILPIIMTCCTTNAYQILTSRTSLQSSLVSEESLSEACDLAFDLAGDTTSKEHATRDFMRLLLCCFVLALPAGLYQNSFATTNQGTVVESWGMVFACVCVLIMLASFLDYQFMKRRSTNLFSRLTVPLMAGGLLVLSVFSTGFESWAGVSMQTGYHLFLIYIYTEFSVFASETDMLPSRVFALGTCAIDIGLLAGFGLLVTSTSHSEMWSAGAILVVVYLILLVGILVFPKILEDIENRGGDKRALELLLSRKPVSGTLEIDATSNNKTLDKNLEKRCGLFGSFMGLSTREIEILSYLLRGRSLRSIATETFLSYNTVKTHVSHIYRKADVHTRDELIDLFDKIDGNHL